MIIYLVDNIVNLIYKKRVIKEKFKSVSKGYIINKEEFINEFGALLKKEKIKGKLLGMNIEIIDNTYFQVSDKYFMENIFIELGFIKVIFKDIKDFFTQDKTFMEINNTYMVLNLEKGIYLDLDYFKDIPKIIDYFSFYIKGDIVLFGVNKEIPEIKLANRTLYYLQNKEKFITDSLL